MHDFNFCHGCGGIISIDDMEAKHELMDPRVPGSYETWYHCPVCDSDDVEPIDKYFATHTLRYLAQQFDKSMTVRVTLYHKQLLAGIMCAVEDLNE